jgi:hypothetical protein
VRGASEAVVRWMWQGWLLLVDRWWRESLWGWDLGRDARGSKFWLQISRFLVEDGTFVFGPCGEPARMDFFFVLLEQTIALQKLNILFSQLSTPSIPVYEANAYF